MEVENQHKRQKATRDSRPKRAEWRAGQENEARRLVRGEEMVTTREEEEAYRKRGAKGLQLTKSQIEDPRNSRLPGLPMRIIECFTRSQLN